MPLFKTNPLIYKTYLALIKNSIGTNMFRHFYAKINNKEQKQDIMKNGELSCAFYASSILALLKLIKESHGTVKGTIKDLKQSGWREIKKPKIGSVIVWEEVNFGPNDIHKHIGFYIGKNKAITNSYQDRTPVIHHWTFGVKNGKPNRKIETIFWNNKLETDRP